MPTLKFDTYGKTGVRLTYINRKSAQHEVRELAVAIYFEGDFRGSFESGDNRRILPTDTMKNTVYALARKCEWDSIEEFAGHLAAHFLSQVSHLNQVTIEISETFWGRIGGHAAAFVRSGTERRTTAITSTPLTSRIISGIKGLQILKTANSGFVGYIKDEYTTLPETTDRLLGTVLEADWTYNAQATDFNAAHASIREVLLDGFATHESLSVQQTLFAMAQAVLDQVSAVEEIHLTMPNKHCLLVDLSRFHLDNPNQVFVPIDEPSGYIEARLAR